LVGEDLSLEVSLPDDSGTINSCQWTSPYGSVYTVDKDNIEGMFRDERVVGLITKDFE
jgi:hypothetical protein